MSATPEEDRCNAHLTIDSELGSATIECDRGEGCVEPHIASDGLHWIVRWYDAAPGAGRY